MWHWDGQDRLVVAMRRLRAWLPGWSGVAGGAAGAGVAAEDKGARGRGRPRPWALARACSSSVHSKDNPPMRI